MKYPFKIETPISHLFRDKELSKDLIEISDLLELRDNEISIDNEKVVIYHSELNILAIWGSVDIESLQNIKNKYKIKYISYHLASRYQDNKIENSVYMGIGKPYTDLEIKKNIKKNIEVTKEVFGNDILIMVENNNHLLTDAYDVITSASFIHEIVMENDLHLLLDLPHAEITAINTNVNFTEYLNDLPLKRCKQLHLSGFIVKEGRGFDSHNELKSEDWVKFEEILN